MQPLGHVPRKLVVVPCREPPVQFHCFRTGVVGSLHRVVGLVVHVPVPELGSIGRLGKRLCRMAPLREGGLEDKNGRPFVERPVAGVVHAVERVQRLMHKQVPDLRIGHAGERAPVEVDEAAGSVVPAPVVHADVRVAPDLGVEPHVGVRQDLFHRT